MSRYRNLTVKEVIDKKTLIIWIDILCLGYEVEDDIREFFKSYFINMGIGENCPWHHFLAYLDQKPVATCTLYNSIGVTGVFWVSTLPHERRKGISTQLLLNVLNQVHNRGFRMIVLQSTEDGIACYKNIGFVEYGIISTYKWRP